MDKKDYPLMMTVKDVASILSVSHRVAYMIMDEVGFPLIRIRRSKKVNREDFFNWLDQKKTNRPA